MCLISERKAWKIPLITGLFTCLLGLACCGVGLKLLEFKKSPSLPPLIAGAPMVVAGIAGMVSVHAAFCLVVGVLSLHLINIFVVKEAKARKLQWAKCQSNFQGSKYCHWYATTLGMAVLSVLAVTLVPLGIICCVTKKYMTSQHESEAKNEHSFTLDQPEEFKVTSNALPSRELRLFQLNYMKKHRGHNNRFHNYSRSPVDQNEDVINNATENKLVKNLVTNGESFRYVIDDSYCLGNPVLHNHTLENETDHNQNLSTGGNEPIFKQLLSDVLLTNKRAEDKSCTENAPREPSHGNLECSHTSQDKACGPSVVPPSKKANEDHVLEDNITDNFSSSKSKPKLHLPSKPPSNKQCRQDDHARARENIAGRNYAFDPKVAGNREPTGKIHENYASSDDVTSNMAVNNESGAQVLGKQELGNHQLSDESVILRVPSNQLSENHVLSNQPMEKKVRDLVADKPRYAAKMYPVKAAQKSSRSALFKLMSRQRGNMFLSNTTDHSFA
ncbi:uncharacterized protein [Acropora muricata]|uniref:uncharacterized protein isoform X2 n=1 Tax=Acropora muricata TaxID=159855 RepID=UPI0034E38CE0